MGIDNRVVVGRIALWLGLTLVVSLGPVKVASAGGPSGLRLDGEWYLSGATVGLATNGVPVGLEITRVDYRKSTWDRIIFDYRYTIGEDRAPHSLALGYEVGLTFIGADLSAVTHFGDEQVEWGGRLRGCGAALLISLCGGATLTNDRVIFGLDLAIKAPIRARQ